VLWVKKHIKTSESTVELSGKLKIQNGKPNFHPIQYQSGYVTSWVVAHAPFGIDFFLVGFVY